SLFVTTSVLLAAVARIETDRGGIPSLSWIRGVVRARVTDIHVLAARKVAYQQDRMSRRRGLIRVVSSWRRAKARRFAPVRTLCRDTRLSTPTHRPSRPARAAPPAWGRAAGGGPASAPPPGAGPCRRTPPRDTRWPAGNWGAGGAPPGRRS